VSNAAVQTLQSEKSSPEPDYQSVRFKSGADWARSGHDLGGKQMPELSARPGEGLLAVRLQFFHCSLVSISGRNFRMHGIAVLRRLHQIGPEIWHELYCACTMIFVNPIE
jgi:hypothetical protein